MKIKLSKIILIVSVLGMILMSIFIANIYKTNIVVNDVYGNRSALGDMNILLQKTGGVFETDEIIINKDSESINKFVKQGDRLSNLTKANIDNRHVFQFEENENFLFEDENSIGMAKVLASRIIDDKEKMTTEIKIKDKQSGKIESYEIDIGEPINTNTNYRYTSIPVKKEGDNLYLVVMYSYFDYNSSEEYVDDSKLLPEYIESTNLSLYKLNLSKKISEQVISLDYDEKEIVLSKEIFSYDNKAYFIAHKKDNKSGDYVTNLLCFDIKTKEISLIDLGLKDVYITRACTADNDKMLLLATPVVNGYADGTNGNIKGILIDLKNNKINNTYKLDMKYNTSYAYMNRIRLHNGKIYAVSKGYVEQNQEDIFETPYIFYVFDENNGEKLYEGNIGIYSNYRVNLGIVTNDEM